MEHSVKKMNEKINDADETFLLGELKASKGDITSREDLHRYSFTCYGCHQNKSASEAIRFESPLEINQSPPAQDDSITFSVSKRMGLFCKECTGYIVIRGKI